MQARQQLEEERRALIAFVSRFDALGLASVPSMIPSRLRQPTVPLSSGPSSVASHRRRSFSTDLSAVPEADAPLSPALSRLSTHLTGDSIATTIPTSSTPTSAHTPASATNNHAIARVLSADMTGASVFSVTCDSPVKPDLARSAREAPRLLDFDDSLTIDGSFAEVEGLVELSFERSTVLEKHEAENKAEGEGRWTPSRGPFAGKVKVQTQSPGRNFFGNKENILPS